MPFPLRSVGEINPRSGMAERRIFLPSVIRSDGTNAITANQRRMVQAGSHQALGGKSEIASGILGMSLIGKRRHTLIYLIGLFIPDRRSTRFQGNQMDTTAYQPTIGSIIGTEIELRHTAILHIFLAHPVRAT